MENQNLAGKLLTKRNIFIVLGVIILVEVVWALTTLTKYSTPPSARINSQTQTNTTSIRLVADKASVKVGEKVNVTINISSNKLTDGTDLIINFDPKLLSPQMAADKQPVLAGNIYSAYPQNSLDPNKPGRITVSGITQAKEGVLANGLFGTIVFQARAAGKAKVSLEFSPGSTVDSNVIESGTGQDVLDKVDNLEINILP